MIPTIINDQMLKKISNKPIASFITIYLLLLLCGVNYFYIGFGLWNYQLDFVGIVILVFLAAWMFIVSIKHVKEMELLSVFSMVFSVLLILMLLVYGFLYHSQLYHVETIEMTDNVVVEVYVNNITDRYTLLARDRFFLMFGFSKGIYSFVRGPQYRDIPLAEKYNDETLIVYETPSGMFFDIADISSNSPCLIPSDSGEDYDFCKFDEVVMLPFEFGRFIVVGY
ncbi:hypothetical protein COW94_04685 [Candidatus Peregrinibacteria bacterium CG22_combo_CG10-13_8_21_14_all_44_10]|nr:MAG: hypothetical protein AUK45_03055 [Candidatus Peregrinibacteria bacterium CG2_30_44_17]PIP65872.1 MAG: hypothetical protein COW94_04685 [Candidatus Peregrinibacteria bacterium CG22_combo_CG10-13_8_21_14_all_44_10]PIS04510.1 MAG: hypothetical protein COT83_00110 [Candidatus Peregrinibacteria bacterium CG10_big_fil_rev_8_21_14_0_10_44_7]PIX80195.1 MAG: hypothetical protein COZ35_01445 [Candidatus Peregrinibacteria bacterium CG_4_10_14_3_um_filter_44_21]